MKSLISTLAVSSLCGLAFTASGDTPPAPQPVTAAITAFASVPTQADGVVFANPASASPASINVSWQQSNNRDVVTGQSFVLSDDDYLLDAVTLRYTAFSSVLRYSEHAYRLNVYRMPSANAPLASLSPVFVGEGLLPPDLGSGPRNITFFLEEDAGVLLERDTYYLVTFGFDSPTGVDVANYIKFQTVGSTADNVDGGYRYGSTTGPVNLTPSPTVKNGLNFYVIGTPLNPPLTLVSAGVATSALVVADGADAFQLGAANYFAGIVERSTGAAIPVLTEAQAATLPTGTVTIRIGFPLSVLGSGPVDPLEAETYRFVTQGNDIYLFAEDAEPVTIGSARNPASRPTLWGLNYLLEHYLGVRWLWPGELGTYVPAHTDMIVKSPNFEHQPHLQMRRLRTNFSRTGRQLSTDAVTDARLIGEAVGWLENHRSGQRVEFQLGHAFGHWWSEYSATHPDYFAVLSAGVTAPYPQAGRAKLRLSNPAVIEQIAQEYIAAGAPKYWNVCPNDGAGFDLHPDTLAWDLPVGQSLSQIFSGKANLTARYVEFWNRLYARLVLENPDVVLCTYAYSAYRLPPPAARPLTAKALLGIVDGYNAYDEWEGWADTGSVLLLRPNWWHQGADAPYLPLVKTYNFFRFAFENGMVALDMDSLLGYWSVQGMNYYLMARMMDNPELEFDDIVAEYTSAFGAGAAKIDDYIRYWIAIADVYNYPFNAVENLGGTPEPSLYLDMVAQGKFPRSTLNGSKYALPHLYDETVLAPAEQLLDDAIALISPTDTEALARVQFLKDGLDSLRLSRDQIALGQQLKATPTTAIYNTFVANTALMEAERRVLSSDHVLWDEVVRKHENRYAVLIRPENIDAHDIDLDGM